MNTIASYPNLLTSYISYFLENEEVLKAKAQLNAQTSDSVYFSIPIADEIKDLLKASTGLDLSSVASVPMRWIKGDTLPHIDRGTQDFTNTYLAYLTDSSGQLLLGDDSYSIEAGSAFVFNEGIRHETRDTGLEPRLLLGPMSESGLAVGGGTTIIIYGDGGTSIYIRQLNPPSGFKQYSYDGLSWQVLLETVYVQNTDTSKGNLIIEFITDITLMTQANYFKCSTENIQFGSSSLKTDGSRPIITITATNYPGLVNNGGFGIDGFSNITICNLVIDGTGGSQASNAGWFGQQYFGKKMSGNPEDNHIINCSSSGDLSFYGGGIVGRYAENITITGCSSSGDISNYNAGGIVGSDANSILVQSCWSTGNIAAGLTGDGCGGIVGANCILATINDCYSEGDISGDNAGGIIGSNLTSIIIRNCYSKGAITGASAGGICGSIGVENSEVNIRNCYTTGNLDNHGFNNGGICGYIIASTVNIVIRYCYTTGFVVDQTGFIIGNETQINGNYTLFFLENNYSEAGSPDGSAGDWNTAHARTALQNSPSTEPGVGTDWISRGASQSFELFNMGYNPYSIDNISGFDLVRTAAATVVAGSSSAAAIIADKSYTILALTGGDSGSYSTITINSSSGSISTTAETVPNTYTVYVYNTGSYNITTFTLTVNELATAAAAAAAVACCARPMNLVNVDYSERTQFIAGNTMIADTSVRRAAYTSYTDLLHKKMAYAAKK